MKDNTERSEIIGCNVYVKELKIGTTTNAKGYFKFREIPMGKYILIFNYVGYKKQRLKISLEDNIEINVFLADSVSKIKEVRISENKIQERYRLEAIVTKIKSKTFENMPDARGECDILKKNQFLPGISQVDEGSSALFVRGSSSDHTKI